VVQDLELGRSVAYLLYGDTVANDPIHPLLSSSQDSSALLYFTCSIRSPSICRERRLAKTEKRRLLQET